MFGQRLEQLLNKKGIQQSALAEYLNMADSTISQWKTGKRSPDIETLMKIAKFFNCTTDYLLGLSDQPSPALPAKEDDDDLDIRIAANNDDGYGQEPSPELKRFIKEFIKEELAKKK